MLQLAPALFGQFELGEVQVLDRDLARPLVHDASIGVSHVLSFQVEGRLAGARNGGPCSSPPSSDVTGVHNGYVRDVPGFVLLVRFSGADARARTSRAWR
ncbi:hypothetical protein GCM10023088_27590 [Actinomadura verrucosospora]